MEVTKTTKTEKHRTTRTRTVEKKRTTHKNPTASNGKESAAASINKAATNGAAGPRVGPGADRGLFEYLERFRWGTIADCKCEDRGKCFHSNSLSQLAWEMLYHFLSWAPESYKGYDMPEELIAFRKSFLAKQSRYDKLHETTIAMVPKSKRRWLKGLLDRAERDYRAAQRAFFAAVGYMRGVTDHEDLTSLKIEAAERLLKNVRSEKARPFYDRVYLCWPYDMTEEQREQLLKNDANHVAPGYLAKIMNWDMEKALRLEADELAREFKRTKDPKVVAAELRVLDQITKFRAQSKNVWESN